MTTPTDIRALLERIRAVRKHDGYGMFFDSSCSRGTPEIRLYGPAAIAAEWLYDNQDIIEVLAAEIAEAMGEREAVVKWLRGPAFQSRHPEDAAFARHIADAIERADHRKGTPTERKIAMDEVTQGWIVGNGDQTKWRMWDGEGPRWVTDRNNATRYARRCDAESVHAEDEDAWSVVPYATRPDNRAELEAALRGVNDDYMTSEKHHPGYVLIPTPKFEQLCAALSSTPREQPEDISDATKRMANTLGADFVQYAPKRAFKLGDRVQKRKGSSWHGTVVGFYSTALTPIGYAIESEREPGSVQIYPESALEAQRP